MPLLPRSALLWAFISLSALLCSMVRAGPPSIPVAFCAGVNTGAEFDSSESSGHIGCVYRLLSKVLTLAQFLAHTNPKASAPPTAPRGLMPWPLSRTSCAGAPTTYPTKPTRNQSRIVRIRAPAIPTITVEEAVRGATSSSTRNHLVPPCPEVLHPPANPTPIPCPTLWNRAVR